MQTQPDLFQLPAPLSLAIRFGNARKVHAVHSIGEGAEFWSRYRDAHCLCASQTPPITIINTGTGATVAKISYNGRAWHPITGQEINL